MPATDRPAPWVALMGRVSGTRIEVSASCLLVVALIAAAFAPRARDPVPELGSSAWVAGAAIGVLVYVAALVHESAHAAVARRHGREVPWIRVNAAGGRTFVRGEASTPAELASIAVAGPALSVAVGIAALVARLAVGEGIVALLLEALVVANLLIGLMDLLPAPPLDGGRLVEALAWRTQGSARQGGVTGGWVGRATAVALVAVVVGWWVVRDDGPSLSVWAIGGLLAALTWSASGAQIATHRARARLAQVDLASYVRPVGRRLTSYDVDPGRCLVMPVSADDVLMLIVREPAEEYVVLDLDGAAVGTLLVADVERAGILDVVQKRH